MSYIIDHYLCPTCASGHAILSDLRTGYFIQASGQLDSLTLHSKPQPTKPTGSRLYETGVADYESGARYFGEHGWLGFESGGGVVIYTVFIHPFASVEHYGTGAIPTTTGKLVLAHLPNHRHYYGVEEIAGAEPTCSGCSRSWAMR